MSILKQLKAAIIDALAVPGRFIDACYRLSEAIREQTNTMKAVQTTITAIEKHVKYLAESKQRELQRAGHQA